MRLGSPPPVEGDVGEGVDGVEGHQQAPGEADEAAGHAEDLGRHAGAQEEVLGRATLVAIAARLENFLEPNNTDLLVRSGHKLN